jgi:DNA-binding IclR family transcriptional regulator
MPRETLKTVERTLALLRAFDRTRPEMTVAELVRRLALPRTVVTRILATLEEERFLERVPGTLKYRAGIAACELGALYLVGNPLVQSSHEVLRTLSESTGFPVYLGTRYGAEIFILALHEGRMPVRFVWSAGDRLPIATTALGKAMLTRMPRQDIDALLGTGLLPGLTQGSLRTRAQLDEQLEAYAHKGWVPAFEESFPGVHAVGTAIVAPDGTAVAGISISFIRHDTDFDQIESMGRLVTEAALAIGRNLLTYQAYGADQGASPKLRLGPQGP